MGRPPVLLDGLDIEKAGLDLDDKGVPCHDRATMRCGDSNVFLAGDVSADLPLLHEASHDGAISGGNAAAYPAPVRTERYVPFDIIFTDPQVVSIGDADEDGAQSGTADLIDKVRARAELRNEGALTVYAAAPDRVRIGADLLAPAGEHLGHLLAWAIKQKMTATQLLEMPFHHPTIEEGFKQALRTSCAATPIAIPENQDAGSPAGHDTCRNGCHSTVGRHTSNVLPSPGALCFRRMVPPCSSTSCFTSASPIPRPSCLTLPLTSACSKIPKIRPC